MAGFYIYYVLCMYVCIAYVHIGYEPADLTVYPPPLRTAECGFILFVKVSSVPQKMSSKESPCFSDRAIQVKRPKTCFSAYPFKPNFNKLNIFR